MELVCRMGMRLYLSSLCSTEQCRGVPVLKDAMPPRKWGSRVKSRGARSTAMGDTAETHIHRKKKVSTFHWTGILKRMFTREDRQEESSFFNPTYQFTYPFLLSGCRSLQRCSWGDRKGLESEPEVLGNKTEVGTGFIVLRPVLQPGNETEVYCPVRSARAVPPPDC